MLSRRNSTIFLNEFLNYFEEYTILATYDAHGRLIVYTNPYLNFDTLIVYICENIFEIFRYCTQQEIVLSPFGNNEQVLISIDHLK